MYAHSTHTVHILNHHPPPHPLPQVSGLSALAACHYLADQRERVFQVLYRAINSPVKELQEAGKTSMKKVSEPALKQIT